MTTDTNTEVLPSEFAVHRIDHDLADREFRLFSPTGLYKSTCQVGVQLPRVTTLPCSLYSKTWSNLLARALRTKRRLQSTNGCRLVRWGLPWSNPETPRLCLTHPFAPRTLARHYNLLCRTTALPLVPIQTIFLTVTDCSLQSRGHCDRCCATPWPLDRNDCAHNRLAQKKQTERAS